MRQPQKFRALFCVVWCLRCVAAASLPSADPEGSHHSPSSPSPVMQSSYPSQEFLTQFTQVSSPNSGDRKHRDASAVLPFIGLTSSKFASAHTDGGGFSSLLHTDCLHKNVLLTFL
ncbi:hypothetical protein XENOCAPTIV_004313 [Xenoophorus captivus]|uniref:Secreted protein n=1 Tax=Xenoophorus captivus TaxID=1517983 RepID=A0ABV0QL62_9TELE